MAPFPLILPLIIIEFVLKIVALRDIARRDHALIAGKNKFVWVLVVLFISTLGPVIYFVGGRRDV